jgi:hypothetical protein
VIEHIAISPSKTFGSSTASTGGLFARARALLSMRWVGSATPDS